MDRHPPLHLRLRRAVVVGRQDEHSAKVFAQRGIWHLADVGAELDAVEATSTTEGA